MLWGESRIEGRFILWVIIFTILLFFLILTSVIYLFTEHSHHFPVYEEFFKKCDTELNKVNLFYSGSLLRKLFFGLMFLCHWVVIFSQKSYLKRNGGCPHLGLLLWMIWEQVWEEVDMSQSPQRPTDICRRKRLKYINLKWLLGIFIWVWPFFRVTR